MGIQSAFRRLRERLPAGSVCLSPWTDLTLSSASIDADVEIDPIVSRAMLENMAGAYLTGGDPRTASPLFADLTGFPPTLVLVGASEALLDDATRFADKATASGLACPCRPSAGAASRPGTEFARSAELGARVRIS